jgi:hypothetical protein
VSRHITPATISTAQIWEKLAAPYTTVFATTGNSENRSVSIDSLFYNIDTLKVATVMQQIITELGEAVAEEKKKNGHYKNDT